MKLKKGFGNKSVILVEGIYQSFILPAENKINKSLNRSEEQQL